MQVILEKVYNFNSVFILNIWRIKWDGVILIKQNFKLEKLVKFLKKKKYVFIYVCILYICIGKSYYLVEIYLKVFVFYIYIDF